MPRAGSSRISIAAADETSGAAMEVPDLLPVESPGSELTIFSPGTHTSTESPVLEK